MTSTTHPADALPLPEPFMAMCRDTVPHIYDAWANQLRAARREGYELAMSKRAAPLSRDQIDKIMTKHYPLDSLLRESVDAFEACVRDIEAALAAPAQEQPAFKIYKGDVCYKFMSVDCVGLPRDKAISFARAVLALSQGGK